MSERLLEWVRRHVATAEGDQRDRFILNPSSVGAGELLAAYRFNRHRFAGRPMAL
ncbi:MAG: hypothetical protein ABI364_04845 [Caldimonas sp.]